jgi:hypothetical protein
LPCMKKKNKEANTGFTFMELIIVSVLGCVIGLAIYAQFNNGLKIWQRVRFPLANEDINIFLDKFGLDLTNCFRFQGIGFSGGQKSLAFASLVASPRLKVKTVGRVLYSFDAGNKVLARELSDFSDIYSGHEGFLRQSISRVKSLSFKYYAFDDGEKKYVWLEEWLMPETLPLAVRMELKLDDANETELSKTVSIPVAGS